MAKDIKMGIDIGSSKIMVVLGYFTEYNKWKIIDLERIPSKGVLRGEVTDVQSVVRCIKQALKRIQGRGNAIPKVANICIGGQHTKNTKRSSYSKFDVNTIFTDSHYEDLKGRSDSVVKDKEEENFLVLPMGLRIDRGSYIKDGRGKEGKIFGATFNVVYGKAFSLNRLKESIFGCGLKVNEIQLKPVAIANSVLTHEEKREGVALVDIGAGTTSIIIYENDILRHVAIIPFGGNTVTTDIVKRFKLSPVDAEIIKCKSGSAYASVSSDEIEMYTGRAEIINYNTKELSTVIQCRMEEIVDSIIFQIQTSEFKNKLKSGIVLTGGTSSVRDFKELVNKKSGMKTRLGYVNNDIVEGDSIDDLSYTTAIGAMICADSKKVSKTEGLKKIFTGIFK